MDKDEEKDLEILEGERADEEEQQHEEGYDCD